MECLRRIIFLRCVSSAMSYHELTRRELQTLCKQNGLPANKSNAVMASSLTSFFSDHQTITQAYAHVVTPSAATKSVKTRALPKPGTLETSLASLILAARKIPAQCVEDIPLKSCKGLNRLAVSSPAGFADFTPLPKSTPLRRRKKSDAIKSFPTAAEDATSKDIAQVQYSSRPVVKEISTPELQLTPHLNADVLVKDEKIPPSTRGPECHGVLASRTGVGVVMKKEVQPSFPSESEPVASSSFHEQDCQNNFFDPGHLQPVLMSPLLRITADVDMLIRRATGMLEKFEQWKVENPNKNAVLGSGQMHLSLDKENLFQQSPYKHSKARSLQGYMSCNATQLDRKEGILKDIDLNAPA